MELTDAKNLALTLMREHGLMDGDNPWSFNFHRRKNAIGTCHYNLREIRLSNVIIPSLPESEVRLTILHEIAHAIAGSRAGHGMAWKVVVRRLGGSDKASRDISSYYKPVKNNPPSYGVAMVVNNSGRCVPCAVQVGDTVNLPSEGECIIVSRARTRFTIKTSKGEYFLLSFNYANYCATKENTF